MMFYEMFNKLSFAVICSVSMLIQDVLTHGELIIREFTVEDNNVINITCPSHQVFDLKDIILDATSDSEGRNICCLLSSRFNERFKNVYRTAKNRCKDTSACSIKLPNIGLSLLGPCPHCTRSIKVTYICLSTHSTSTRHPGPSVMYTKSHSNHKSTEISAIFSSTSHAPTLSSTINHRCPETFSYQVHWDTTAAGDVAMGQCPNNDELFDAKWQCQQNPVKWIGEPDFSLCVSPSVAILLNRINATKHGVNDDIVDIANALTDVSLESDLQGGDLSHVVAMMNDLVSSVDASLSIANRSKTVNVLCESVVGTGSNLLIDSRPKLWGSVNSSQWSGIASMIMMAVEDSAFMLINTSVKNKASENIIVAVKTLTDARDDITHDSRCTNWTGQHNTITLTKTLVNELANQGQYSLVLTMFNNLETYLSEAVENDTESECDGPSCTKRLIVNSNVISASISSCQQCSTRLHEPIVFILQHKQNNASKPVCSFWKFANNTSTGQWSSEGCKILMTNISHTACSCQHLTFFAILMSPTAPEISKDHLFALEILTYVGLSVSIVCLLLAFVTFVSFRRLASDRNTIHTNMSINLLLAHIAFLVGAWLTGSPVPIVCKVIAGISHYLFLTSFSWMCVEGVQLYVLLIEVFETEKSRFYLYYVLAYGVPAIIVGVSATVSHNGYGTPHSCWLTTERGFIWAFLGPVLVIIVVNSIMLGIALRVMYKHSTSVTSVTRQEKDKSSQIRLWIRGAISLEVLLGLSWAFGFAFVSVQTLAFAYIFTFLNSLQGLFIFIFYCACNEKVQAEYKRFVRQTNCFPECCRVKCGAPIVTTNTTVQRRQLLGLKQTNTSGPTLADSYSSTQIKASQNDQNELVSQQKTILLSGSCYTDLESTENPSSEDVLSDQC